MQAIGKRRIDLSRAIFNRIVELKQVDAGPIFTAISYFGDCELSFALAVEDWELAKDLVQYSSLDAIIVKDRNGRSLWMWVLREGQFDLAQLIINRIRELNPQATFTLAPSQDKTTKYWRIPSLTAAQLVPKSAQR